MATVWFVGGVIAVGAGAAAYYRDRLMKVMGISGEDSLAGIVVCAGPSPPGARSYARVVEALYQSAKVREAGVLDLLDGTTEAGRDGLVRGNVDEGQLLALTAACGEFDANDPRFARTVVPVLRYVMRGVIFESTAFACADILRRTTFVEGNDLHEDLLDILWALLKGGRQRDGNGRISTSWGQIGFQGKDPVTDLRGMGMLGLYQLVYFATTPQGLQVLEWSCPPAGAPDVKFFPFACAGIQITSLIYDLARKHKLGSVMLRGDARIPTQRRAQEAQVVTANEQMRALLEMTLPHCGAFHMRSMAIFNDIYAEVFTTVGALWHEKDPVNVMAWPAIFKEASEQVEASISGLRGGGRASEFEIRWRD